jgi:hypothetical protein
LYVVNLFDPNLIPMSMYRNRGVIINTINDDMLQRGTTYATIKGLR